MAFKITTTGTQDPVEFNDLAGASYSHPTTDYDLTLEYSIEEINQSQSIQDAITLGYITVTDEFGNDITDMSVDLTMKKSTYDVDGSGVVDLSEETQYVHWNNVDGAPEFVTSGHTHTESDITDLDKYSQAYIDANFEVSGTVAAHEAEYDHTNFSVSGHLHTESDITDLDKYTQAEVDANISGQIIAHHAPGSTDHDDRYYTEAESDANFEVSGTVATHKTSADHDGRYYTETEADSLFEVSGTVDLHKSSSDHDGRYYTETELDGGQLDSRYYTETEADGLFETSGTVDLHEANYDHDTLTDGSDASTLHIHDGRYYTETEADSLFEVSGTVANHESTYDHTDFVTASTFDTKGDILVATADDTYTNLGVGSSGQVLAADPGTATGLTWTNQSAGGGTPGGSDTQVQYNNSDEFGGISGVTSDGTTLTFADDTTLNFGTTNSSYLQRDTGNNELLVTASSTDNVMRIRSSGDVALYLEADTGNSGENDNPFIYMSQDGGGNHALIGLTGDAGTAPDGGTVTNAVANTLMFRHNWADTLGFQFAHGSPTGEVSVSFLGEDATVPGYEFNVGNQNLDFVINKNVTGTALHFDADAHSNDGAFNFSSNLHIDDDRVFEWGTGDTIHSGIGVSGIAWATGYEVDITFDTPYDAELLHGGDTITITGASNSTNNGTFTTLNDHQIQLDRGITEIEWQSGNSVRYGVPYVSAGGISAGDIFTTKGNGNSSNDGNFFIDSTATRGGGGNDGIWVYVTNTARSDDTDDEVNSPGECWISIKEVRILNPNRDDTDAYAEATHEGVTFTADEPGFVGEDISLVFNGSDTVTTVVDAWNTANPTNTVDHDGTGSEVLSSATVDLVYSGDDEASSSAVADINQMTFSVAYNSVSEELEWKIGTETVWTINWDGGGFASLNFPITNAEETSVMEFGSYGYPDRNGAKWYFSSKNSTFYLASDKRWFITVNGDVRWTQTDGDSFNINQDTENVNFVVYRNDPGGAAIFFDADDGSGDDTLYFNTDELGFFGTSTVAQQSGTGETTGFTAGAGTGVNDDSTFTGNVGSTAYRINDIVKALKNYGLLAS